MGGDWSFDIEKELSGDGVDEQTLKPFTLTETQAFLRRAALKPHPDFSQDKDRTTLKCAVSKLTAYRDELVEKGAPMMTDKQTLDPWAVAMRSLCEGLADPQAMTDDSWRPKLDALLAERDVREQQFRNYAEIVGPPR